MRSALLLVALGLTAAVVSAPQDACADRETEAGQAACRLLLREVDNDIDAYVDRSRSTAQYSNGGAVQRRADISGDNIVFAPDRVATPIIDTRNPLVADACRQDVMRRIESTMADERGVSRDRAMQDVHEHMQEMRTEWAGRDWLVHPSEVIEHVAGCREVCRPMVQELASCHVWAVANSPLKTLLSFQLASSEMSGVPSAHQDGLQAMASKLRSDSDLGLVLIGRASRDGDPEYNYSLSFDRTESVKNWMVRAGIRRDRISTVFLGENPPQITPAIAGEYGLADMVADNPQALCVDGAYDRITRHCAGRWVPKGELMLNRSVMAVAYQRDE